MILLNLLEKTTSLYQRLMNQQNTQSNHSDAEGSSSSDQDERKPRTRSQVKPTITETRKPFSTMPIEGPPSTAPESPPRKRLRNAHASASESKEPPPLSPSRRPIQRDIKKKGSITVPTQSPRSVPISERRSDRHQQSLSERPRTPKSSRLRSPRHPSTSSGEESSADTEQPQIRPRPIDVIKPLQILADDKTCTFRTIPPVTQTYSTSSRSEKSVTFSKYFKSGVMHTPSFSINPDYNKIQPSKRAWHRPKSYIRGPEDWKEGVIDGSPVEYELCNQDYQYHEIYSSKRPRMKDILTLNVMEFAIDRFEKAEIGYHIRSPESRNYASASWPPKDLVDAQLRHASLVFDEGEATPSTPSSSSNPLPDTILDKATRLKFERSSTTTEDRRCDVCDDPDSEPNNEMVFCDGCDVAVHQDCYGIEKVPVGPWRCNPCLKGVPFEFRKCEMCPLVGGALKPTIQGGRWIHVICALWLPGLHFKDPVKMEPVIGLKSIPRSLWNSRVCKICGERQGIALPCHYTGCPSSLHASCALMQGCTLDSDEGPDGTTHFYVLCAKHSPDQTPSSSQPTLSESQQSTTSSSLRSAARKRRRDDLSSETDSSQNHNSSSSSATTPGRETRSGSSNTPGSSLSSSPASKKPVQKLAARPKKGTKQSEEDTDSTNGNGSGYGNTKNGNYKDLDAKRMKVLQDLHAYWVYRRRKVTQPLLKRTQVFEPTLNAPGEERRKRRHANAKVIEEDNYVETYIMLQHLRLSLEAFRNLAYLTKKRERLKGQLMDCRIHIANNAVADTMYPQAP
eukprot:TRINITY_DN3204_c0_g1::TRINITY_DN3204_c0_g1_i1::g.29721::m.29721 TRINITY_DN3204_c0_g1::TRINITY_DN3204_c0_g1_i1::g.29721  ORF type:complete len:793 (-),score=21.03,sp/Q803A0/JADE1_DANRE/29.70/1e-47,zf-HC5HC2H_2/PF13832.1/86,zf-HC5HC2H_2/PF13832.1/1.2e-23,zf-HC5HC2H/PF13771.1/3.6e+02,zf-HC5HC2H/PF13771.1/2.2e-17,PHD_2/PF13831.1/6.4e-13,PHD_2/PF13831.1/9.5e+02,PHD/PF00628.24/4.9e-10,PHD/PF00628.24/2.6,C1_1/PF00130.17/0.00098,C1_1/PF00130.17/1.5e+03,C1_1/PF00130.17/5.7e+02,zf-PHD-like/PF15446.1/0.001